MLQIELHANEDVLAKPWKQLAKRETKAAAAAEAAGKQHLPITERSETTFIPALLTEFLQVWPTSQVSILSGRSKSCTAVDQVSHLVSSVQVNGLSSHR